MATEKIKVGGSFVAIGGGAAARNVSYGPESGLPDNSVGNDKDVYVSTNSYNVWQKLSGVWTNVAWTAAPTFYTENESSYQGTVTFAINGGFMDGNQIYITTDLGTFSISFYDGSMNGGYGRDINIDISSGSVDDHIATLVGLIGSSFSGIVECDFIGSGQFKFTSITSGPDGYVQWTYDLTSPFAPSTNSGTNYGGIISGTVHNDPIVVKAAEVGKRHFVSFAQVYANGVGNNAGTLTLFWDTPDDLVFGIASSSAEAAAILTSGFATQHFSVPNTDLVLFTSYPDSPGFSTTVSIIGFTLTD